MSPTTPTRAGTGGTETAERVADILLAVIEASEPTGVSAIARELGISKAVVHRILQSLVSRGLVQADPASRAYVPGPTAVALGLRALGRLDVRRIARDLLVALRNTTGETTTLSLLAVDRRSYVDQYESPQEIKMTVELGRSYPLYAGASSRVILAHLPQKEIDRIIAAGVEPLTEETIRDVLVLRGTLEDIRRHGYAESWGERQNGAASVAAPFFGGDGAVLGAISVCGPIDRFPAEVAARYVEPVLSTAHELSHRLGWVPSGTASAR